MALGLGFRGTLGVRVSGVRFKVYACSSLNS